MYDPSVLITKCMFEVVFRLLQLNRDKRPKARLPKYVRLDERIEAAKGRLVEKLQQEEITPEVRKETIIKFCRYSSHLFDTNDDLNVDHLD